MWELWEDNYIYNISPVTLISHMDIKKEYLKERNENKRKLILHSHHVRLFSSYGWNYSVSIVMSKNLVKKKIYNITLPVI